MYQKVVTSTYSRDRYGRRVKTTVIGWEYVGPEPESRPPRTTIVDELIKAIEYRRQDVIKLRKDFKEFVHSIKEMGVAVCEIVKVFIPESKPK
jgi:hypothetical protein